MAGTNDAVRGWDGEMSTLLAKAPAHVAKVCYEYDNTIMSFFMTRKCIDQTKKFKLRSDDVFILSYPKTGTTWAQQIMLLVQAEAGLSFFEGKHIFKLVPFLEVPNIGTRAEREADSRKAVVQIAEFMGKSLPDDVIERIVDASSFKFMKKNTSTNPDLTFDKAIDRTESKTFMRKGIVGDWRSYFSEDQNRRFDQLYQEKMAGSGLELRFE